MKWCSSLPTDSCSLAHIYILVLLEYVIQFIICSEMKGLCNSKVGSKNTESVCKHKLSAARLSMCVYTILDVFSHGALHTQIHYSWTEYL